MLGKFCVFGYVRWAREYPKHQWLLFVWEVFLFFSFCFLDTRSHPADIKLGQLFHLCFWVLGLQACTTASGLVSQTSWNLVLREQRWGREHKNKGTLRLFFFFIFWLINETKARDQKMLVIINGVSRADWRKWACPVQMSVCAGKMCYISGNWCYTSDMWNNISSWGALCRFPSSSH